MQTARPARPGRLGLWLLTVALLVGCSASPTTTYIDRSGRETTVDWRDYPGHAHISAEEILSGPTREQAESLAEALLSDVESALGREYGLRWRGDGEAGWYPQEGNGYGGKSAYSTYNSANRISGSAPPAPEDWQRIVDIVNGILADHGFDALVLDHQSSPHGDEETWQREQRERFGTDDPDEYWVWSGAAHTDSQWLSITLLDVSRDPSGKAAAEAAEHGWAPRSITLGYGATALSERDIENFRRDLAPFAGLEKPEPTTSD